MKDATPRAIHLKDYRVPDYLVDSVELHFDLREDSVVVRSALDIRRNPAAGDGLPELQLNGVDLDTLSLCIDGVSVRRDCYRIDGEVMHVRAPADRFRFEAVTRLVPQDNRSLEGLYKSGGMYCTQCEAEGFRKITWYPDRPDVLAVFTVHIEADPDRYPVLLSNGNPAGSATQADGRRSVTWHDPFPKPSYLFALVAGELRALNDTFITASGRSIELVIWVEPKDLDKCDHAMDSLKRAMRWDEENYGREYDLDVFNVVAVDDFNMGAMENKGLNIFNTSCVLARSATTVDSGFQRVEAVVAHEYFHNWSGNRVTCRDWFQLSLKEGFTVFRDACFSADMGSAVVKRVEDVLLLRSAQFAEDAGPMAHPVRPDSFIEISNFYTVTVYEKGAEVVRMLHTLLGAAGFRAGTDVYFDRHDGQAVTCDDFVAAMEAASGRDLSLFRRWYSQAGTPVLQVDSDYDAQASQYRLRLSQHCPDTPGQSGKLPFHIPVRVGLVGNEGPISSVCNGVTADEHLLELTGAEQEWVFDDVGQEPVPSLLRHFSAPVKVRAQFSREQLARLMQKDSDGFCRWDAAQQLGVLAVGDALKALTAGAEVTACPTWLEACAACLAQPDADPAMLALMLQLPTESWLLDNFAPVDPLLLYRARQAMLVAQAVQLQSDWRAVWQRSRLSGVAYAANAEQIGRRSLANLALARLMKSNAEDWIALCDTQYAEADNMTDRLAALTLLVHGTAGPADQRLAEFLQQWKQESLVVNQWLQVQSSNPGAGTLETVRGLQSHDAYDPANPNKLRALIGAFTANTPNFHAEDGSGYEFLREQVAVLNRSNPQMASRLLQPFTRWARYSPAVQTRIRAQLEILAADSALSSDVFEVVSKSLAR